MTTPAPLELDLDPSGYLQGLSAADAGTANFATNVRTAALAMGPFQRALHSLTPSRALLGGMGALATGAANVQSQLATMSAQAKVTGANMGTLTTGMRQLARDLPVGNAGARQITAAITSMGIAAAGSERNVSSLASVFSKLSGATGSGAVELAQGFIQLNRVMGTGTSASTMGKLADSLTTVSAKAGVSASGVLQFSKLIAPMAQSLGIGETKVLGISAAFAKLGEDGGGAATAFNKVLLDMNQSVKQGAPGLSTYASIVGRTTKEFSDLVKSNPAEALTQFTEAIGKSPNAQRQLQSLGLDGVRTQRYIQELAASGGLRSAINQSTGAYGDGSTDKAAKEAFKGLSDASQRAAANAGQLGEALGAPLLGPLTKFTNILGSFATPARSIAESRVGQGAITAATYATLLLGVMPRILRGLGIAQLVGSGPVRTAVAGFAAQRAGGSASAALAAGGLGTRFGRSQLERMAMAEAAVASGAAIPAEAALGAGLMGRINPFAGTVGAGAAALFGRAGAANVMTGASALFGRGTLRGTAIGLAQMPGLYLNTLAESARLARVDPAEREFVGTPRNPWTKTGRAYQTYADRIAATNYTSMPGFVGPMQNPAVLAAEREAARTELFSGIRDRGFKGALAAGGVGAGNAVRQGLTSAGSLGLRGLGIAGGMLAPLATPMVGLMAAGGIYSYLHNQSQTDQATRDAAVGGTTFLDQYRIAMGKATDATNTFAGRLESAAGGVSGALAPKNFGEVSADSTAAQQAARGVKGKAVYTFSGSERGIAAQLSREVAQGMTPDELQRAIEDLSNQKGYNARKAQDVLGMVRTTGGQQSSDYYTQVAGMARTRQTGGSWAGIAGRLGIGNLLTGGQTKADAEIGQSIFNTRASQLGTAGATAANRTALESMNQSVSAALKAGNKDLAGDLVKNFFTQAGVGNGSRVTGSVGFLEAVQKGGLQSALGTLANAKGMEITGGTKPAQQFLDFFSARGGADNQNFAQSSLAGTGAGSFLTAILSGRGAGAQRTRAAAAAGQNLFGPTGQPESPQAQLAFTQTSLAAANAAGMSMDTLAKKALAAGTALTDGTDEGKAAFMIFNAAVQQAAVNLRGLRPGQVAAQQAGLHLAQAQTVPTDTTSQQLQQQGVQSLQQDYQTAVQQAQSRLEVQRQFQITSTRSAADYNLQRVRAEESYNIQVSQATDDFHKNQRRAQRDFGIAMARMAEDAAKSMYDPYQRIQAKGVWDARSLAGNMREQNQALQAQISNLARARKAGVSNQAITMLGLDDPNNAQQLAHIIGDLVNDPSVVKAINNASSDKQGLAGKLVGDPSNTATQRFIADTKKAMTDMTTDYNVATKRAAQAHSIQMNQMANDYTLLVSRAKEDMVNADKVMTSDLDALQSALNKSAKGQWSDFSVLTKDGLNDWVALLKSFQSGPFQQALAGLGVKATLQPLDAYGNPLPTPQAAAPVAPGKGGIPTDEKPAPTAPHTATATAASTPATRSSALRAVGAVSPTEGASLIASGSTTVNVTHVYDSSVTVQKAEVTAQDPNAMGRALQAKAARSRLNKPGQAR